jgi:hypothetical protein
MSSDTLSVSTFGSAARRNIPSRLVHFGLKQIDGSVRSIHAMTIATICDGEVLPRSWPMEEKVLLNQMCGDGVLADDPFDTCRTLDILIGADFMWEFIRGPNITTPTNISFIPTTFGFMWTGCLPTVHSANHSTMLAVSSRVSSGDTVSQPCYRHPDCSRRVAPTNAKCSNLLAAFASLLLLLVLVSKCVTSGVVTFRPGEGQFVSTATQLSELFKMNLTHCDDNSHSMKACSFPGYYIDQTLAATGCSRHIPCLQINNSSQQGRVSYRG